MEWEGSSCFTCTAKILNWPEITITHAFISNPHITVALVFVLVHSTI